jgi:hypothetical protein
MTTAVQQLEDILSASAASDEFKDAVLQLKKGVSSPLVQYNPGVPAVKAIRGITKLLEAEPALAVESLKIQGSSGCSDFTGTIEVNGGEAKFEFVWDCAWRAKEAKLTDHFGFPDQIRAAREFGYQCFQIFRRIA